MVRTVTPRVLENGFSEVRGRGDRYPRLSSDSLTLVSPLYTGVPRRAPRDFRGRNVHVGPYVPLPGPTPVVPRRGPGSCKSLS